MNFLNPGFLWALMALAVPVLIHLFNFRRFKKVYFTNVKFLKDLKEETQKQQKLKHLLVLLSRMLMISFLVFAFAQPYIKKSGSKVTSGSKAIGIYVDNSFSMNANGSEGQLLEVAKNKARELVAGFRPSDRFQLLTNDFEGRHQRLVNKDDFLKLLDEVQLSPSYRTITEVAQRQQQIIGKASEKVRQAFIISDLQSTFCDAIGKFWTDTSISYSILPLSATQRNNVFIDSCWFSTPYIPLNSPLKLFVRIRNLSETSIESGSVSLNLNGRQKSIASFTCAEGLSADVEISFTINQGGWYQGELSILDSPISFDDNLFFSFYVQQQLPVICINANSASPYINAVFGSDSYFHLTNVPLQQIDYSSLFRNKLIILNELEEISSGFGQELQRFLEKGGNILVIPSPTATNLDNINSWLRTNRIATFGNQINIQQKVDFLNTRDEVFSDVFEKTPQNMELPQVIKFWSSQPVAEMQQFPIMKLADGQLFIAAYKSGKGRVFTLQVPLSTEWSDLPKHALFVPLMYKLALTGGLSSPLYYVASNDKILPLTFSGFKESMPVMTSTKLQFVPEITVNDGAPVVFVGDQVNSAGTFSLRTKDMNVDSTLQFFSFNYSRKESITDYIEGDKLNDWSTGAGFELIDEPLVYSRNQDLQISGAGGLWKWCIILSLLFYLIEVILLRFWK